MDVGIGLLTHPALQSRIVGNQVVAPFFGLLKGDFVVGTALALGQYGGANGLGFHAAHQLADVLHLAALTFKIGDFFGVAQWLPPGTQPDDGPIGELFVQNMSEPKLGEVLFLFEQMAGFHPHEPHWYIPLIGVDPVFQGLGYGTKLMRHGLVACDRDQLPAYLEATSPASRSLYERHGFRALGEIRSGDSPPLFPMLREPR